MTEQKRVLIADDDESLGDVLARRCESLGLRVERAFDGKSALHKIDELVPDLVILDINMPEGNGLSVCEMIARDPDLMSIPIIMLTGRKDDKTIQSCNELKTNYVPKGAHVWARLEPLICGLLGFDQNRPAHCQASDGLDARSEDLNQFSAPGPSACLSRDPVLPECGAQDLRPISEDAVPARVQSARIDAVFSALAWDEPSPDELTADELPSDDSSSGRKTELLTTRPWVLCIDDDPGFAAVLKLRLERHGVEVLQAFAGVAGYRHAFTSEAQAIILDYELPDGNGDYVLRRLKENPVTKDIPVIVLTGKRDHVLEHKMYNLGAVRYFTKPVGWEDLWGELRKHLRLRPEPAGV